VVKTTSAALSKVLQEIGTSVYQKAAEAQAKEQSSQAGPQQGSPQGETSQAGQGEKVVDADYKVVDEEKK
jgi:molecular chaperone DnaK